VRLAADKLVVFMDAKSHERSLRVLRTAALVLAIFLVAAVVVWIAGGDDDESEPAPAPAPDSPSTGPVRSRGPSSR